MVKRKKPGPKSKVKHKPPVEDPHYVLLEDVVTKSFLDQDWLTPIQQPLIDILKVAVKDYIHGPDQERIKNGIKDLTGYLIDLTDNKSGGIEDQQKQATKEAEKVKQEPKAVKRVHFQDINDQLVEIRESYVQMNANLRNPFHEWFLNGNSGHDRLTRESFLSFCHSVPYKKIKIKNNVRIKDDEYDDQGNYVFELNGSMDEGISYSQEDLTSPGDKDNHSVGGVHWYHLLTKNRVSGPVNEYVAKNQVSGRYETRALEYDEDEIQVMLMGPDPDLFEPSSGGYVHPIYRCPEPECVYHGTGMSSKSMARHVKQKHPHIKYDAKLLERIHVAEPKVFKTIGTSVTIAEESEDDGYEDPGVPKVIHETIEEKVNKLVKKGYDEEDVAKCFGPPTFNELCTTCEMAFFTAAHFAYHEPCVYQVTKPGIFLKCPKCEVTRSHPEAIRVHLDRQHLKTPRFECKECGEQASTNQEAISHLNDIHANEDNQFRCTFDDCHYGSTGFPTIDSCRQHVVSQHLDSSDFEVTEIVSTKNETGHDVIIEINTDGQKCVPRRTPIRPSDSRNRYRCPALGCIYNEIGMRTSHLKEHLRKKHRSIKYDLKAFEKMPREGDSVTITKIASADTRSRPILPVYYRRGHNCYYRCPQETCHYHEKGLQLHQLQKHIDSLHADENYQIYASEEEKPDPNVLGVQIQNESAEVIEESIDSTVSFEEDGYGYLQTTVTATPTESRPIEGTGYNVEFTQA